MTARCLIPIPADQDYETRHELEWLSDLGTHAATGKTRRQLVEGYLKGCEKRQWGTTESVDYHAEGAGDAGRDGMK